MTDHRDLWWPSPTVTLGKTVEIPLAEPFRAEYGGELPAIQVSYESWGDLNAARDNAVLVIHPMTADCHATGDFEGREIGWWEPLIGPGRAIDTNSAQLADALGAGVPIIISTIHKFGFIQDKIEHLPDRRYAIIVDEAHSSQSGEMAVTVKELLSDSSIAAGTRRVEAATGWNVLARLRLLEERTGELARLREESTRMKLHWQKEKELIAEIRSLTQALDLARGEEEAAKRGNELERAAEIMYDRIPKIDKQIKESQQKLAKLQKDVMMLKEEVDAEDIASVVSNWTHIPVSRLMRPGRGHGLPTNRWSLSTSASSTP